MYVNTRFFKMNIYHQTRSFMMATKKDVAMMTTDCSFHVFCHTLVEG